MPVEYFDFSHSHSTQRACLNGHIVSNWANNEPSQQKWCSQCGKPTIVCCPACEGPLRGGSNYGPQQPTKPDDYCIHCGKALPWTERHLEAMREVAQLTDSLDDADRATLTDILPDLASKTATPQTQVGIVKMKKLFAKGGVAFVDVAKTILVDVVSETVKKALWP